jgi:WD40 repeat protein
MDDRSQKYIQGIEGSECITALDLSPSKKLLAVCERAERAICRIFDTSTFKRRKVLTSFDYNSKEFVSVSFAPTAEKTHLVTLTGEPDIRVLIWTWDKGRCLAQQAITGISGNMTVIQCSFHI